MDSSDLKIYVKPEDKKAYYACAGGTGAIELALICNCSEPSKISKKGIKCLHF